MRSTNWAILANVFTNPVILYNHISFSFIEKNNIFANQNYKMPNYWLFILLVIFFPFLFGAISIAPRVPTKSKDARRAIEFMKIKWWEIIYEIGSWDGRIIFELWKSGTNIKAIWIEINIYLYLYSILRKRILGVKNVEFLNKNFYNCDLSWANIVYLYGLPDNNSKVIQKLKRELKTWTRVISYVFELPWLKLIEKNKPTKLDLSIYEYEI